MIIIIESGSTKSDWRLIKDSTVINDFTTIGYNPFFHNKYFIEDDLQQHSDICKIAKEIKQVYFYGAGCSSKNLKDIIHKGLSRIFINAVVEVDHDLVASALSTYEGSAAITCILGTGSNSCFFDGVNCLEEVPALGYVLGDEGSGSYFGKQLITAYLYNQLPNNLFKDFNDTYNVSKDEILHSVYSKSNVNKYLASFAQFLAKYKNDIYVREMLVEGFCLFISKHVYCYKKYETIPVNFVGSIAFYFQDSLSQACKKMDIHLGSIIQKPIDGLVRYIISNKKAI